MNLKTADLINSIENGSKIFRETDIINLFLTTLNILNSYVYFLTLYTKYYLH